mmetsp:Transcript_30939/g.60746  ORF Transcript_30939/g.60746 Transcript_30939/m.60746 type:complete len:106 (+) Transcript_30939:659-976(+)
MAPPPSDTTRLQRLVIEQAEGCLRLLVPQPRLWHIDGGAVAALCSVAVDATLTSPSLSEAASPLLQAPPSTLSLSPLRYLKCFVHEATPRELVDLSGTAGSCCRR